MKKVYICSAYSSQGKIEENVERAKNYSRMAIEKMCLPITPHIYFTQFMSDDVPIERAIALNIGLELIDECDELWIFGTAAGGMDDEIDKAILTILNQLQQGRSFLVTDMARDTSIGIYIHFKKLVFFAVFS